MRSAALLPRKTTDRTRVNPTGDGVRGTNEGYVALASGSRRNRAWAGNPILFRPRLRRATDPRLTPRMFSTARNSRQDTSGSDIFRRKTTAFAGSSADAEPTVSGRAESQTVIQMLTRFDGSDQRINNLQLRCGRGVWLAPDRVDPAHLPSLLRDGLRQHRQGINVIVTGIATG